MLFLVMMLIAADPTPAPAADPLALARAALEARDAECEKRALEALQAGGLDERGAAEAWSLRARCYLVAGDQDRAARSFAAALRIDPSTAAVDDESFRRARAELLSSSLAFRVRFDGAKLSFELVGDDLQLAKSAVIVDGAGTERARVPLEVGHATHEVSGVDVEGARAQLLDRWGNRIARAAIERTAADAPTPAPTAPPGAEPTAPSIEPGALSYVGAGMLAGGIIGLTIAGITTAMAGSDALTEAPFSVAGLGAGALLFVAGAALVVVDQAM